MILLSGDLHGNSRDEASSITKAYLLNKYGQEIYSQINYNVILGDCAFLWSKDHDKTDRWLLSFLGKQHRGFPMLCLFGNHENYDRLLDHPLVDIGIGDLVYEIYKDDVYYLQRGHIYNINGYKILALGGAYSIDKAYRSPHISWWEQEYWTAKEERDLFELIKTENKFDYIFSHTAPFSISQQNPFESATYKINDRVADLTEELLKQIEFKKFFCGHWHFSWKTDDDKYEFLYKPDSVVI
jgi:hypothetical protein